jgi:hypothetical protein
MPVLTAVVSGTILFRHVIRLADGRCIYIYMRLLQRFLHPYPSGAGWHPAGYLYICLVPRTIVVPIGVIEGTKQVRYGWSDGAPYRGLVWYAQSTCSEVGYSRV